MAHKIIFGTLTPAGLTNIRQIKQSDLAKCPWTIFDPDHYREDGSCKCDDATERKRMIKEWGYTPEDFKHIPLRKE